MRVEAGNDSPESACAVVPPAGRGFEVFGYALAAVEVVDGEQRPFSLSSLTVAAWPSSYEILGFDVVSKSCSAFFECSPLSCNGMAAGFP
jgi:hypothetical protein